MLLQMLFLAAEVACHLRAEVVREGKEDLGAERLKQRAPGLAGQRGPHRADALGRHDRDAPGLTRQVEELLVARGIVFADGGKLVVFVAEKQHLPEVLLRMALDHRDAIQDGPLEVELHEGPDRPGQAGIAGYGKVQCAHDAHFDELRKRRQRYPVPPVGVQLRVVTLLRRAESAFDGWVIVKEREKDRDPLDDRSPQLRFDAPPVVIKPAANGLVLLALVVFPW